MIMSTANLVFFSLKFPSLCCSFKCLSQLVAVLLVNTTASARNSTLCKEFAEIFASKIFLALSTERSEAKNKLVSLTGLPLHVAIFAVRDLI